MNRLRFAYGVVAALALVLFAFAAPAADSVAAPAIEPAEDGARMTPLPEEEEPWLLPEPQQLSCTASFTCPDGSFLSCTDPAQCYVNAGICSIRCGTSNVYKCNDWPPGCNDPCQFSTCIGWGWSRNDCEELYCEGIGGPD